MRSFLVPRRRVIFFLCAWVVGVLAGILAATGMDDSSLSVMRLAAGSRVSIVSLFLTASVPFLITAVAVSIHQYPVLLAICFARSFCFGCCAWLGVRAFGSAAWLIQPMLQFSDGILMAVFLLLGLWLCSHEDANAKRPVICCILFTGAVTLFDYLAVAPFLASLLES